MKACADTPAPIDYNVRRAKSNIGFKYSLRQRGRYFDRPNMLNVAGWDSPGPVYYPKGDNGKFCR